MFITWLDYVLLPFYLLIVYAVAYRVRDRFYPAGHPWRPYFLPGLTMKIVGAVGIGMVYQYYYGTGDTAGYFYTGEVLNSSFSESPGKWVKLMLRIPEWYDAGYSKYTSRIGYYFESSTHTVSAITALLMVPGSFCYLPTSVIFACVSFTGMWALFRTFAVQYPKLVRPVAIAVLFIPSTFVWGSGIWKDTLCIFGLGWLTYGAFQILLRRNLRISNLLITTLAFWIIAKTKLYILLAFVPALGLWIMLTYSHRIRNPVLRAGVRLAFIGGVVGGLLALGNVLAAELGKYSLEKVSETSRITREYIQQSSGETGSAYDLGEFDEGLGGMLSKAPLAINVTLFRPYLWQANKPIVFFNALEATLLLILTITVFAKLGPGRVWKAIRTNPNIQFALIFTLIFAFAVGVSTYNFGTLSRYRIPCLPFFGLTLVLIFYSHKDPDRRIIGFV